MPNTPTVVPAHRRTATAWTRRGLAATELGTRPAGAQLAQPALPSARALNGRFISRRSAIAFDLAG